MGVGLGEWCKHDILFVVTRAGVHKQSQVNYNELELQGPVHKQSQVNYNELELRFKSINLNFIGRICL